MGSPTTPHFEITGHTVFRQLDNEAVLLNLNNGQYYSLNELGTHIWNTIQQHDSIEDLIIALEQEYEVSPEQLKTDVRTLIQDLITNGLIEEYRPQAAKTDK